MSLTDARREVSAMRATFSDALVQAAEICETAGAAFRAASRGDQDAESVSHFIRKLCNALNATRDATMTWAAMDTLMREVER